MRRNNRLFTPRGNLHLSRRDRDRAGEQQAEAPRDVRVLHQRNRCVPACLSTLYHPCVSTFNSRLIITRHADVSLGKAHFKGRRGSMNVPVMCSRCHSQSKCPLIVKSAPPDPLDEGLSQMSDQPSPGEPECDDDDLEAAAQHLEQDFICQVLQEEQGLGGPGAVEDAEDAGGVEEATPLKHPSLASILGPLPSAASLALGLCDSIQECIAGDKDSGECVYNSNPLAPISSLKKQNVLDFSDASSLELGSGLMVMNMEVRIFLSPLLGRNAAQSFHSNTPQQPSFPAGFSVTHHVFLHYT